MKTGSHILTILAILAWIPAILAQTPADPANDRSAARITVDRRAVCPVCGMFVAPHAEWLAQVTWPDGSEAFFDGPKDLFKYLLQPERYAGERTGERPETVLVTSYYEGEAVPAREAFFVVGSDVLGPMGAELVPHRTRADAEEFLRDHHGDRVVELDDITQELLNGLE